MSDSRRVKRIGALIQDELSSALMGDVADPTLAHLVINEVELSKDFRNAKIYYGLNLDAEPSERFQKEIDKGLKRVTPFFRKRLSLNLDLRFVPELHFERDLHAGTVARVISLLDEVKRGEPI